MTNNICQQIAAFVWISLWILVPSASAVDELDIEISKLELSFHEGRLYVGNFPSGNNDPNPVRRRFLGLGNDDRPDGSPNRSKQLHDAMERALELHQEDLTPAQRDRLCRLTSHIAQLTLQGWLVNGNVTLMEGLRISYPSGSSSQSRPQFNPIPFGCLEDEFPHVSVKDATRANLFYTQAVRFMLDALSRNPGDLEGKRILDIDVERIPAPTSELPGSFSNERFPQYTYFVDRGNPSNPDDDRVVASQTEGYMMGNVLQKQGQATETIAHRLWSAAYFSRAAQREPASRGRLLDAAVQELHAGANVQFMANIALAATVGDEAEVGAESPFEIDKLTSAAASIENARTIISRIRNNEIPTLPIDEIMAGDVQVAALINKIADPQGGPGSIARAKRSYETARDALFKTQQQASEAFAEEQTRQTQFIQQLISLTGIPIPQELDINTAAGQSTYRHLVGTRINTLVYSENPDLSTFSNSLDEAVKIAMFQRQEVFNAKATVDSYQARIKVVEDTLEDNKSAIDEAEGKIFAATIAQGIANSISISESRSTTISSSVSVGTMGASVSAGISFSTGTTVTKNPGAIKAAKLQNDITRATNLKEMRFLENEASARIKNLLIDQDLAHGKLRSQIILLRNAEDSVNKVLGDAERILSQLRAYNDAVAELWYNDPVWNIELTANEEAANRDLDSLVRNLYSLAKMLEIRWIEAFANPITVVGGEPLSLGQDYENFWSLESVFALGSVNVRDNANINPPWQQGQNFYHALKEWDLKLRSHRRFEGDTAPINISLRQDVFGFADVKTDGGEIKPLDTNPTTNPSGWEADRDARQRNIRKFHNLLLRNGMYIEQATDKYRGFLIQFPLSYYDIGFTESRLGQARLFGNINAWNYRIRSFKVKVNPLPSKQVFARDSTEVIFAQAGTMSNINFLERISGGVSDRRRLKQINLDNYVRYDRSDLNQSGNSPFLLFSIAKQRNYPTDQEVPTASNMGTRFWSPFTSNWMLQFVPHIDFEIENIEDIQLELKLTTGEPSTPTWVETP